MSGMLGGGSSQPQQQQPTSSTVTQTNLPAWAQPYSEKLLGQAGALTDINQNPYQQYQGQRLADFTPMQQQAFSNVGNMQVSPQNQQATNMAGAAGLGSLGAGQQYNQMATNPYATQAFMSPYQQNVTDYQKQQAVMDYNRGAPAAGSAASKAGAFGGSRQAIVESEANRSLQNQLAGIQATGSQNAFQNAQQAMQYGAGLGMQGYNQALQGASTLGQLGQNQYNQQTGINAAQQQVGAQQQAFNQQGLTNQYQDFLNQQNYPYQQLGFMSDILHGTPTGGITSAQTSQAAPTAFNNMMSLGLGAYGASKLMAKGGAIKGYKEGGAVKGFAGGGITGGMSLEAQFNLAKMMSPTQLESISSGQQRSEISPAVAAAALPLAVENATASAGAQAQQELAKSPGTVIDRMMAQHQPAQMPEDQGGVASLPAENMNDVAQAAEGGVMGYASGGGVQHFQDEGEVKLPASERRPFTAAEEKAWYERAYAEQRRIREAAAAAKAIPAAAAAAETIPAAAAADKASLFSRMRAGAQPTGGFNPEMPGAGKLIGGGAKLLGKAFLPFTAYDTASTALSLAGAPTSALRRFYGADPDDRSILGDAGYRARAAVDSLNPFADSPLTAENLRKFGDNAPAAPAASSAPPARVAAPVAAPPPPPPSDKARTRTPPSGIESLNASPEALARMQANIDASKAAAAPAQERAGIAALEQAGPPAPPAPTGFDAFRRKVTSASQGYLDEATKLLSGMTATDSEKNEAKAHATGIAFIRAAAALREMGPSGNNQAKAMEALAKGAQDYTTETKADKKAALAAGMSLAMAKAHLAQGDTKIAADMLNHSEKLLMDDKRLAVEHGQWTAEREDKHLLAMAQIDHLRDQAGVMRQQGILYGAQATEYPSRINKNEAESAWYRNRPLTGAITPAIRDKAADNADKIIKNISELSAWKSKFPNDTLPDLRNRIYNSELARLSGVDTKPKSAQVDSVPNAAEVAGRVSP